MKRILLLTVVFLTSLSSLFAERISLEKAMRIATNVANSHVKTKSSSALSCVYTAPAKGIVQTKGAAVIADYYVFNIGKEQGFVIVSGEDRVAPILAYATIGSYKAKNLPSNIKAWMESYQDQIYFAVNNLDEAPA